MSDMGPASFFGSRLQDNKIPKLVIAAISLGVMDQLVHATIPASGTYVITLPPVMAAIGKVYHVRVTATAGGTSVTVEGKGAVNYVSTAITAVTGFVTVMSVGEMYVEIDFSAT